MRTHYGMDNLPEIVVPVVTIGSFDGVHRGHVALLQSVIDEASRIGGSSVVITFSPHPRQVLGGAAEDFRLLTTLEEKIEHLAQLGIDELIVVEFTRQFASLSSEEFVRDYLVARLGMKSLVVGYNHRFGHDRNLPSNHFELLGNKYGFEVVRAGALTNDGAKISSTVIRSLIAEERIAEAEELLGHKFTL